MQLLVAYSRSVARPEPSGFFGVDEELQKLLVSVTCQGAIFHHVNIVVSKGSSHILISFS